MEMKFSSFLLIAWFSVFSQSGAIALIEGKYFPVLSDEYHLNRVNNLKATLNANFLRNCSVQKAYKLIKVDSDISTKQEISFRIMPGLDNNYVISFSGINLMENLNDIYIESRCHPLWNTITKIENGSET